ncbi:MAG: hypothetical protein PSV17_13435 [Methylotenera sp.]|uniref:hypothetical protein n=1 Tax=Methylotenera sp. TaxID=2051956 RepID=UPI00248A34B1|nr:hypothetical protein [Methylotenera sp.]MDI1310416.1 hypothetical protein [Methylotenera sp.]
MRKPSLLERLRAKKRTQSMIIGVTWYTDETWLIVKAAASDPECFEESFSAWEAMAVTARRDLQRSGARTLEFHITPQELFDWCEQNKKVNNAESRAEFVSEMLMAAHNR